MRVSKFFTDDDAITMHLETLWYDLKKHKHRDINVYYIHHVKKVENKKVNYFLTFLKYFKRI